MRSVKKIAIYAFACLLSSPCYSQAIIPGSPNVVQGGDEVRGRDGTTCRQGNYQSSTVDFGVSSSKNDDRAAQEFIQEGIARPLNGLNARQGWTVYGRVVIPLGNGPKSRIDCGRLYNLEIQRLELEIEQLKSSGSANVEVK